MATSPNFGWLEPDNTDLVKNGALAIRTLGNAIDASLAELKGGTTGQVLSKTSNTDMDFTWVAQDDSNAIQNAIVDAKGDLIAATAADTPARLAVGTNGQVLTADSTAATGLAWASASSGSSNVAGKNVLINGAFDIWQRGTSFTTGTLASPFFIADRWQCTRSAAASGATITRQTSGAPANFQYYVRMQRDSGNTSTNAINLGQCVETVNTLPYAGKTVTLSFYARCGANYTSGSNNLNVLLYTGTGTDQNNFSGSYTGLASPINSTATVTTSWQRFTFTVTLASTVNEFEPLIFTQHAGTAGANDYVDVTGVQLEISGSATEFSRNASTIALELTSCQRYFMRPIDGSSNMSILGQATGSTTAQVPFRMPVEMRVAPTLTVSSATNFFLINSTGGVGGTTTSVTAGVSNTKAVRIDVVGGGLTAGNAMQLQESGGSPWIALSAEL